MMTPDGGGGGHDAWTVTDGGAGDHGAGRQGVDDAVLRRHHLDRVQGPGVVRDRRRRRVSRGVGL